MDEPTTVSELEVPEKWFWHRRRERQAPRGPASAAHLAASHNVGARLVHGVAVAGDELGASGGGGGGGGASNAPTERGWGGGGEPAGTGARGKERTLEFDPAPSTFESPVTVSPLPATVLLQLRGRRKGTGNNRHSLCQRPVGGGGGDTAVPRHGATGATRRGPGGDATGTGRGGAVALRGRAGSRHDSHRHRGYHPRARLRTPRPCRPCP